MMRCKNCGAQLSGDQPFCLNCGAEVGRICPSCKTVNKTNTKYCSNCGWPLIEEDSYLREAPIPEVSAKRNTGLIVTVVLFGFIILGLLTFLLFTNLQSTKTETNVTTTTPAQSENSSTNTYSQTVDTTPKTHSSSSNSNYSSGAVTTSTRISGNSGTTSQELVNFYNSNSPIAFPSYYENRGVTLSDFAEMYVEECEAENIRADVAFCQMIHETGWLRFGGDVSMSQFNFAGLGATGGGEPGYNFAAKYGDNSNGVRMGIRAQVQHLKAYSSTDPLNNSCIDERFDLVERGSAPTIGGLSGTWSTDEQFGEEIVGIINRM